MMRAFSPFVALVPIACLQFVVLASGCENGPPPFWTPKITCDWIHIFDPNKSRHEFKGDWYCNDHTLVQDGDGRWHAYGIIGHRPANPWDGEKQLFHASAATLLDPSSWEDHGYAMSAAPGVEAVLWAPHVLHIEDRLWMFYNAGNLQKEARNYASWGTLHVARSEANDGHRWVRDKLNPLFGDPGHARDSFVAKFGDKYCWYYTRTVSETNLESAVAVRTSPDLVHWSGPQIVHTEVEGGHWGGNCESPQVIYRDGLYYLFVTAAMEEYDKTLVYWSSDPFNFPRSQLVTELETHAPEVVEGEDGRFYITTCGWGKNGVYIAELDWRPASNTRNTD